MSYTLKDVRGVVSRLVGEREAHFLVRTSEQSVILERVYSLGVTPSSEELLQAVDLGKWQVEGLWGKKLRACVKL